ncbi:DNA-binding domain-containing protein [Rhodoferax sp. PAMC 29310]|uniref:HvfC/BufC N-terminal domain-containing protein n=1 Tax=Rhodoferax sp. PAMC 29310 TaxID=2822760 RepID=UPI001B326025|nr:DNA-binding domain-containing protein [Rhodoferax sp. PAMC 29310]
MISLAAQQQALLETLFEPSSKNATNFIAACAGSTRARGLKAYQTNGHMLAERSLKAAFPVLVQLIGDENLPGLARAFWHAHPPEKGDLARWGAELPEFIRASEQLASEPYLADVAAVEWALHVCAGAPDQLADPASFGLLMQHDPLELQLQLAPGCIVFSSAWPVASILGAHLSQTPSFENVRERFRASTGESTLVWREGYRPRVRETLAGETGLVTALLQGQSLGDALDHAPDLDFNTWLPMAAQSQLLLGAALASR